MFRKYILPCLAIIACIVIIGVSCSMFAYFGIIWATAMIISATLGIVGAVLVLISRYSKPGEKKWLETTKYSLCVTALIIFLSVSTICSLYKYLPNLSTKKQVITPTTPVPTVMTTPATATPTPEPPIVVIVTPPADPQVPQVIVADPKVEELEQRLSELESFLVYAGPGIVPDTPTPTSTTPEVTPENPPVILPTIITQNSPRWYEATGTGVNTKTFTLIVNTGENAIVGGFKIDGVSNGVYKGYGPGTYTVTITDGFALITSNVNALGEWNFRLAQAKQFGWACAHIDPGPIK